MNETRIEHGSGSLDGCQTFAFLVSVSCSWRGQRRRRVSPFLDYTQRLQRLAMDSVNEFGSEPDALDTKTLALVRLAALISIGGAVPSYGAQADAAIDAGATAEEIVDVLVGVIPIVGLPSVVAAAPKLAMALGYDTEAAI